MMKTICCVVDTHPHGDDRLVFFSLKYPPLRYSKDVRGCLNDIMDINDHGKNPLNLIAERHPILELHRVIPYRVLPPVNKFEAF